MSPVWKRPLFLLDLAEELIWLRDHAGADIAERWFQGTKETIRFLQTHPEAGRVRRDLHPEGIRSWRVNGFPRWLIFYTLTPCGEVILLRVRHGSRDLPRLPMAE